MAKTRKSSAKTPLINDLPIVEEATPPIVEENEPLPLPPTQVQQKKNGSSKERMAELNEIKKKKFQEKKAQQEDIKKKKDEIEKINNEKINYEYEEAMKLKKFIDNKRATNAKQAKQEAKEDKEEEPQTSSSAIKIVNREMLKDKYMDEMKKRVMKDLFS